MQSLRSISCEKCSEVIYARLRPDQTRKFLTRDICRATKHGCAKMLSDLFTCLAANRQTVRYAWFVLIGSSQPCSVARQKLPSVVKPLNNSNN